MNRRWRPRLAFVLGGALCGTLALSFAGLIVYRYLGPAIGFKNAAIILATVIAAATCVLGYLLVRLLLRPITELQRFATQVSASPQHQIAPPAHFGTQELHTTALGVIEMAQTLQNREMSIRSFADHVTHELKAPVAVIKAASELLVDGGTLSDEDQHLIAQITGASDQMERHLDAMQRVVKAREVQHTGTTTLAEMARDLQSDFADLKLEIEGDDVGIPLAQAGARIVFGHLLSNSQRHAATDVHIAADKADGQITVLVKDNGTGISKGNQTRIFDPFFTTMREDGGTGMGLAIARNTLRAHGGDIAIAPSETGAAFLLRFQAPVGTSVSVAMS